MARENRTKYIILGLLNHEDLSGYDIKKRIDVSLKHFWDLSYGQIYPTLKQLLEDGYIHKVEVTKEAGPERITYSISEKGKLYLVQWLKESSEEDKLRSEMLLKLFFSSLIEREDVIHAINEFAVKSHNKAQLFSAFEDQLTAVMKDNDDHVYYYLSVLFGKKLMKAYIDWSEEATEILSNKKS